MDAVFEVKPELNAEVSARQFDKAKRIGWLDQHRRRSPMPVAGTRTRIVRKTDHRRHQAYNSGRVNRMSSVDEHLPTAESDAGTPEHRHCAARTTR